VLEDEFVSAKGVMPSFFYLEDILVAIATEEYLIFT
jgi:hypothetical protein